jgi:hypothetical protein
MSDRRTFLVQMGALPVAVTTTIPASVTVEVADRHRVVGVVPVAPLAPVVGFLLDQPYLDPTGLATPYRPPAGLRSAQPLANTFDAAFHQGIWFQQDQS